MPTYQYECNNCGHSFEAFQSMKDEKLKKCPQCGMETLQRLIGTGAGLIFKGSGFYLTDYVKKDSGSDSKKSGAGEKKDGTSDTTATEKSPPAKSEPAKDTAKSDSKSSE